MNRNRAPALVPPPGCSSLSLEWWRLLLSVQRKPSAVKFRYKTRLDCSIRCPEVRISGRGFSFRLHFTSLQIHEPRKSNSKVLTGPKQTDQNNGHSGKVPVQLARNNFSINRAKNYEFLRPLHCFLRHWTITNGLGTTRISIPHLTIRKNNSIARSKILTLRPLYGI